MVSNCSNNRGPSSIYFYPIEEDDLTQDIESMGLATYFKDNFNKPSFEFSEYPGLFRFSCDDFFTTLGIYYSSSPMKGWSIEQNQSEQAKLLDQLRKYNNLYFGPDIILLLFRDYFCSAKYGYTLDDYSKIDLNMKRELTNAFVAATCLFKYVPLKTEQPNTNQSITGKKRAAENPIVRGDEPAESAKKFKEAPVNERLEEYNRMVKAYSRKDERPLRNHLNLSSSNVEISNNATISTLNDILVLFDTLLMSFYQGNTQAESYIGITRQLENDNRLLEFGQDAQNIADCIETLTSFFGPCPLSSSSLENVTEKEFETLHKKQALKLEIATKVSGQKIGLLKLFNLVRNAVARHFPEELNSWERRPPIGTILKNLLHISVYRFGIQGAQQ